MKKQKKDKRRQSTQQLMGIQKDHGLLHFHRRG